MSCRVHLQMDMPWEQALFVVHNRDGTGRALSLTHAPIVLVQDRPAAVHYLESHAHCKACKSWRITGWIRGEVGVVREERRGKFGLMLPQELYNEPWQRDNIAKHAWFASRISSRCRCSQSPADVISSNLTIA
jgi:hypothetical protein